MLQNGMKDIKAPSCFEYPVKIWFIIVSTAPFIYTLIMNILNSGTIENIFEDFLFIMITIEAGIVFSIPTLFLFWLLCIIIKKLKTNITLQKTILCIAGIGFIVLSFYAFDRKYFLNTQTSSLILPGSYAIVLILAIFLVKMNVQVVNKP